MCWKGWSQWCYSTDPTNWTCRLILNMLSRCLGGNNITWKTEKWSVSSNWVYIPDMKACRFSFKKWVWNTYTLPFPYFLIIMHICSLFIRFSEEHTHSFSLYLNCRLPLWCMWEWGVLEEHETVAGVSASEVLPEKKRLWNRIPE